MKKILTVLAVSGLLLNSAQANKAATRLVKEASKEAAAAAGSGASAASRLGTKAIGEVGVKAGSEAVKAATGAVGAAAGVLGTSATVEELRFADQLASLQSGPSAQCNISLGLPAGQWANAITAAAIGTLNPNLGNCIFKKLSPETAEVAVKIARDAGDDFVRGQREDVNKDGVITVEDNPGLAAQVMSETFNKNLNVTDGAERLSQSCGCDWVNPTVCSFSSASL